MRWERSWFLATDYRGAALARRLDLPAAPTALSEGNRLATERPSVPEGAKGTYAALVDLGQAQLADLDSQLGNKRLSARR
jgi:hypothetical protein